jgi:2-hydroxychromene-2-carboxylate isomerase
VASPIRFYFDFTSSFSYIAIHCVDGLAARYGRLVDWRVISLGHLFQAQTIVPPPSHPEKFKHLSTDSARSCAIARLPCVMPTTFPPDVRLARYMFWRLKAEGEGLSHRFARLVSMAVFGRGEELSAAAQIAAACAEL